MFTCLLNFRIKVTLTHRAGTAAYLLAPALRRRGTAGTVPADGPTEV